MKSEAKTTTNPGFFLQIPWELEIHLERMSPLARRLFKTLIELIARRPNWGVNSRYLAREVGEKYRISPPSQDRTRKALKWLRDAGFVTLCETFPGANSYRVRLAGIHADGPPIPRADGPLLPTETENEQPVKSQPPERIPSPPEERLLHLVDDPRPLEGRPPRPLEGRPPRPLEGRPSPYNQTNHTPPNPPGGEGEGIDQILEAWAKPHREAGSPLTSRTVERALAAAAESNPELSRSQLIEQLAAMAGRWEIPPRTNHPILRAAKQNFAKIMEERPKPAAYAPFEAPTTITPVDDDAWDAGLAKLRAAGFALG